MATVKMAKVLRVNDPISGENVEISAMIKALRTKYGLTQRQLADKIGVTAQTIFRYEKGTRSPSLHIIKQLGAVFGLNLGYAPNCTSQATEGKPVSTYYRSPSKKDIMKHWIDSLDYNTFDRVEQLLSIAGIYNEESASSMAVSDVNKNPEKL